MCKNRADSSFLGLFKNSTAIQHFVVFDRQSVDEGLSSWQFLESQMCFDDSTNYRHQGTDLLHQCLGECERKLLRVPLNSIRKVREASLWPVSVFTCKITVLTPTNPSFHWWKWINAFSKHRIEFSVSRFVSEALEEEKPANNSWF
jgi:hypothetical protein